MKSDLSKLFQEAILPIAKEKKGKTMTNDRLDFTQNCWYLLILCITSSEKQKSNLEYKKSNSRRLYFILLFIFKLNEKLYMCFSL